MVCDAIKLAGSSLWKLRKEFEKYLRSHREEDNHLDDDVFDRCVADALFDIPSSPAPELNSAHITEYFELDIE